MVAVGPVADLPAAGLPTERQGRQGRQHFSRPRMEAVVLAATHAAGRPAAGKASGAMLEQAAPRKSLSMGALKAQRSRLADDAAETEPLMASHDHDGDDLRGEEKIREDNASKEDGLRLRKEFKTEYKKKFRPFSQYDYVEGRFQKRREDEVDGPPPPLEPQPQQPWYAEVIELRKKAGEYKHRGWGTELAPEHMAELYSKQHLLWEQVSRRSSLSALALAAVASPRSISKEEKERENSRRTSPSKASSLGRQRPERPHTAQPKLHHERSKSEKASKIDRTDDKKDGGPRSSRKEFPLRHHLERTTGAGRSQSLGPSGPSAAPETRSPKRSPRTASAAAPSSAPPAAERRPRPTTLNTTAPSRSKSRTSAPSKGDHQAQANKAQPPQPGRAAGAATSGNVAGRPKAQAPAAPGAPLRASQRARPASK